ncbi:F0F1 ATP synthase subunit B family protein [Pedomonas mirosovicensis]|uniref:F0F1 ATP synthase subunit B family protein n=1 Tax=Pedomonas mirosovicensis TaxID=2908641 RepID=UPI0021693E7E|nr:hypothetical protein [Pedomonas mirosovicensis]MCH8685659.1 hypothetical protein [Pedomonas mirosovicensis]
MSTTLYLLSAAADGVAAATDAAAPVTEAIHTAGTEAAGHEAHPAFLGLDSHDWVAVGTLIFIGILLYMKVPAAISKALDSRISGIKAQLDQAEKLRAEAEALKAEYQAKLAEAERTAGEIIAHAKSESDAMLATARQDLEALTDRRRTAAENKIAVAERAAIDEIRDAAIRAGSAAAQRLISEKLSDEKRKEIVDASIGDLDRRLH